MEPWSLDFKENLMKKSRKKIVLAKETIGNLNAADGKLPVVNFVAGGISTNVCTNTSDFRSCGPYSVSVCPPGTGC